MRHDMLERVPLGAIHGRFQPFHNGHFRYLVAALELADIVYVGITNPQAPDTGPVEETDTHRHLLENNPFSFSERERMIQLSAAHVVPGDAGRIVIVPFDVNGDRSQWPDAIPLNAVQYVVPHEPWDFEKAIRFEQAGYRVHMLNGQVRRVTATEIRESIASGDERWRTLVPTGTATCLTDTSLLARVARGAQPENSRRKREMGTEAEKFWEDKHQTYATKEFVTKPNWLASTLVDAVAAPSRILDLGCGQGQDSVFFAENGHQVVAVDFSEYALERFSAAAKALGITQVLHDLGSLPYPFEDASFDVVYAHLSLHYFTAHTTRAVFAEVARLLKPAGTFTALFNSDRDLECSDATSVRIENRYLELSPGDRKRYFTESELAALLGDRFNVIVARYGRGTTKNSEDEYVELSTRRVAEGVES